MALTMSELITYLDYEHGDYAVKSGYQITFNGNEVHFFEKDTSADDSYEVYQDSEPMYYIQTLNTPFDVPVEVYQITKSLVLSNSL